MRAVLLGIMLAVVPGAAYALTTPKGGPQDARVQTAPYRAEDVIALHAAVGKALLVQLPQSETVTDVTLSDTADMLPPVIVANSVTFKPKAPMSAGPLFVYARVGDGERIYKFELDATADATGTQPIAVIVTDPGAAARARAAAAQKAAAARQQAAIRAELDQPPAPPRINTDYTARGPLGLLGR
ncbi:MAG TPA: TrbG/VirB9 family P-type conjugative transfer protein [Acetobacteraceae bacterium]|nr:TrbG/VirB9 family P-type conjugative transfer protein [Acetobacteraceae bacterium]